MRPFFLALTLSFILGAIFGGNLALYIAGPGAERDPVYTDTMRRDATRFIKRQVKLAKMQGLYK